jgi:hypothetical protein
MTLDLGWLGWQIWFGHHCCLLFPSLILAQPHLPLHAHGALLKLTPCRQGSWQEGVGFQPHQPNCSSFPADKWYKVWSCTSQCPNFNHLSALIDTNGFYKCKSLSCTKLHVFEEAMKRRQTHCSFSFQGNVLWIAWQHRQDPAFQSPVPLLWDLSRDWVVIINKVWLSPNERIKPRVLPTAWKRQAWWNLNYISLLSTKKLH